MSSTSVDLHPASSLPRPSPGALAFSVGMVLALVVMAPQAWSVWTRGTFLDPDDAMRAVEIRDFLAGQGWFDMVPHRLSPAHPFVMHWSRLVDLPLGMLQRLFELCIPAPRAERAMRIVAPVAFFATSLLIVLHLVRRLAGMAAMLPAALLLATSAELVTNFLPGHIHHHGLQAMLLLSAVAALLGSAIPDGRPWQAGVSGLSAILSLGVGLQNLPFVIVLAALAAIFWVVRGASQRRHLAAFGLGLGGALPVFLLDVPVGRYAQGACDAFSAAHLVAAGCASVVALGLAAASPLLRTRRSRLTMAAPGAGLVLAVVACTFPRCLQDPMADVDPLLRETWLSGVGEALPLPRLIAMAWPQGMALLLTLVAGLAATAWATLAARAERRAAWAGLLLLAFVGVVGTCWQVRVAASTCALLVPGIAWAVIEVFRRTRRRSGAPALLFAALVLCFGGGTGWNALAIPLARWTAVAGDRSGADPAQCFDPDSFAELAQLPPGLVLSTIDPGSAILAYTPHAVLAAPYHRNTFGISLSVLALMATPDAARPMIRDAGVRYLALCRTSNETQDTAAAHPDSLSAAIMAGRVPEWLIRIDSGNGPFRLFRVK